MSEPDDDIRIPVSALQHWSYCPRQCALIHLEQVFEENIHTLRGRAVHQTVDMPGFELRTGVRVERALPIFHDGLGLVGKADVVEYDGSGTPYPVEYKHGSRSKRSDIAACDDVQLAAQAMCLEAMTGRSIPEGALFYSRSRRRRTVRISEALRRQVEEAVAGVKSLLEVRALPPPTRDPRRCRECSLKDACQPEAVAVLRGGGGWERRLFDPGEF